MSEITSFGSLVSALNAVRHDYNEQLKSIAQYEAFLLVESSTQKVAETLNGLINTPKPSMAAEVISTLELAKTKFKEHLTSVPEYRALLAIDKLISEVSIDLGVQPVAKSVLPADELKPPAHHVVSAQHELEQTVSAAEATVALPEAAETGLSSEVITQHEVNPPVSAFEPAIAQSESAQIASTHQTVAAQLGSDHAFATSERADTQPATGEIALAQPTSTNQNEPSGSVSLGESSQAPTDDKPPIAEPPPTPFGEGSERAA